MKPGKGMTVIELDFMKHPKEEEPMGEEEESDPRSGADSLISEIKAKLDELQRMTSGM